MNRLLLSLILIIAPLCSMHGQILRPILAGPIPVVAGCPTTDNFTGTNGTALATYNSCWSTMVLSGGDVANCVLQSNEVRTTANFNTCSMQYNLVTDSAQFTLSAYADEVVGKKVCIRAGSGSTNKSGYCVSLGTISGANWTVINMQKNGGFYATITGISAATASSHTLKITASGTSTVSFTVILDGSAVTAPASDSSSPLATGNPGGTMGSDGSAAVTGMSSFTTL